MQESVEYLGYRIDAEGVHPTGSKLEVIIGAPVPQNIQQLRSLLGLLNYYGIIYSWSGNSNQPVEFLAQEEPRMGLDGGLLEGIQDG